MSDTATLPDAPALGTTFEQFMQFLREPTLPVAVVSPQRFGTALHMDLQDLAELAHVHRNTVTRAPGSKGVQDFLRQALRVIRAATDVSGDVGKSLFWFRNEPIPPFDYKTAEVLVSEGRADDLVRYLGSLNAGAAG